MRASHGAVTDSVDTRAERVLALARLGTPRLRAACGPLPRRRAVGRRNGLSAQDASPRAPVSGSRPTSTGRTRRWWARRLEVASRTAATELTPLADELARARARSSRRRGSRPRSRAHCTRRRGRSCQTTNASAAVTTVASDASTADDARAARATSPRRTSASRRGAAGRARSSAAGRAQARRPRPAAPRKPRTRNTHTAMRASSSAHDGAVLRRLGQRDEEHAEAERRDQRPQHAGAIEMRVLAALRGHTAPRSRTRSRRPATRVRARRRSRAPTTHRQRRPERADRRDDRAPTRTARPCRRPARPPMFPAPATRPISRTPQRRRRRRREARTSSARGEERRELADEQHRRRGDGAG